MESTLKALPEWGWILFLSFWGLCKGTTISLADGCPQAQGQPYSTWTVSSCLLLSPLPSWTLPYSRAWALGSRGLCAPPRPLLQAPGQEASDLGHSWHSNPPRIPAGAKSLVSGEMTSELWTWLAGHCLGLKVLRQAPVTQAGRFHILPLPQTFQKGSWGFLGGKTGFQGRAEPWHFKASFVSVQLPDVWKQLSPGLKEGERDLLGWWGWVALSSQELSLPLGENCNQGYFSSGELSRASTSSLSLPPPPPAPPTSATMPAQSVDQPCHDHFL